MKPSQKGRRSDKYTRWVDALEPRRLLAAVPVADLQVTESEDYQSGLPTMARVDDTTYFTVQGDANRNSELWKIDDSGKALVKSWRVFQDIVVGPPPRIGSLTDGNGTLYFTTGNTVAHVELWKSDGTAAGTVMIKAFDTSQFNFVYHNPQIRVVDNRVYFLAPSSGFGNGLLWVTDGTDQGKKQVTFAPTSTLVALGGHLY